MFLKTAITWGPEPMRIRLASSRSVPSRTPCKPFSIPQWSRLTRRTFAAPARARGRLTIPYSTSTSTLPR